MAEVGPPTALREEYDDERCRDFLVHELGVEITRFYRYTEGIHEVQKRIILRYGDENFARAIGVFKELLERDDNASGLGDDGDLWRSWRHDYKLRGENLSDPGTPRFSGMILPAPVAPRRTYIPLTVASSQDQRFELEKNTNQLQPRRVVVHTSSDNTDLCRLTRPLGSAWANLSPGLSAISEESTATASTSAAGGRKHRSLRLGLRRLMSRKRPVEPTPDMDPPGPPVPPKDDLLSSDNKIRPQSSHLPPLCFDGACDFPDNRDESYNTKDAHHSQAIDTEQSLSLTSPQVQPAKVPEQNSTAANRSTDSNTHTSRASAGNSSNHISSATPSTASSKDDFRNLTRELLNTYAPNTSLSMLGNFSPLEPAKYSPPPTIAAAVDMSDPYMRYASVAVGNPFADERQTTWPGMSEDQARLLAYVPYQSPSKPKGMNPSQSESNIAFLGRMSPVHGSDVHDTSVYLGQRDISPTRGRSTSPVKYLDDLKEEVVVDGPPSPVKRSRSPMKKMFGENGWLGRSASMKEMPNEQYKKTGLKHWGGKIKQRVEDLTEDMTRMIPNPFSTESSSKPRTPSKFPVSLDPPTQAKLFSEIELMICVTANTYLMQQRTEGRMSVESLIKITEFWKSKGRPQVIEFQYDQATQRDLVLYNLKTFRFYGPNMENSIAINSMMYNWKVLAKEIAVRTFCTPDSVIRKHLHDIYKILELLGAPLTTFLAFQEIQVKALKTMREQQKQRDERERMQYGVERAWIPPNKAKHQPMQSSRGDMTDAIANRFT